MKKLITILILSYLSYSSSNNSSNYIFIHEDTLLYEQPNKNILLVNEKSGHEINTTIAQRQIKIKPYYISKYEVTQSEWVRLMKYNPSWFTGNMRPVENVTWYDAILYCNALSKNEDLDTVYSYDTVYLKKDCENPQVYELEHLKINWFASGYRLPTEVEWFFAAYGNSKDLYLWGNDFVYDSLGKYVVYADSTLPFERFFCPDCYPTANKGSKAPNKKGLMDVNGNISEWCSEWFGEFGDSLFESYPIIKETVCVTDTKEGPPNTRKAEGIHWRVMPNDTTAYRYVSYRNNYKVHRGASSSHGKAEDFRTTKQFWRHPGFSSHQIGFRVVRRAN